MDRPGESPDTGPEEEDETLIRRPSVAAPAAAAPVPSGPDPVAPEPAAPGLREAVLAGRFFGAAALQAPPEERAAARLAEFCHGGQGIAAGLAAWFGAGAIPPDRTSLRLALDRDIATIDAMMGDQIDVLLHQPRFQALEGRWRGLHWLLSGVEPGRRVKVRLLQASWAEICRDLERALEFDQSNLFRRIYEDEFGMAGGEPFGLMIIDHPVRHRPSAASPTDDVTALTHLASVGAAAFCPMVLPVHPSVLEVDDFGELAIAQEVGTPLKGPAHARWRALGNRADSRFIALTLPRLLARHPWEDDPARWDGFRYAEHAPDARSRCWMGAAYAFAACALRAYAQFAWPADVRGVEVDRVGGGLVTGVTPEPFASGPPYAWARTGIELRLSEGQERALIDTGLMPVSALPYGPDMVFGSVRSVQVPSAHMGLNAAAADANARLSSQVNALLCASRFAHHLKVMGRDMLGSFQTGDEIERRLNRWLQAYVDTNINTTGEARARFPLIAGEVQIREQPGRPGVFGCVVRLQPHYQLDDLSTVFNLVTELAAPGGR